MPALTHAHIELTADRVPIISGTTMKVVELIRLHLHQNWNANELHEQFPYLTLGQIHSALSYFHDNEAEIRAGAERLLARIEPDARLRQGDAVSFTLDPAHCLLVAR